MMEGGDSLVRRWEDLDSDILVKIFQSFDLLEFTSGPAQVCTAWQSACSDQCLWKTLDLSMLKSNFIKIPCEPDSYTAERCPQLKRLVMPAWNRIEETGICRTIRMWEDLESLTMPDIEDPPCVMEEIGSSCKNFAELKIMGPCDMFFASALVKYLPNLKVLSVRCTLLSKPALVIILEGLKKLEVLNISHCLITKIPPPEPMEVPPPEPMEILTELDESILDKSSMLREFLTCMSDSCIMCQRTRNDEGLLRWHRYEEDLWKVDEVKSLVI